MTVAKNLLNQAAGHDFTTQLQLELDGVFQLHGDRRLAEGVNAFAEKRATVQGVLSMNSPLHHSSPDSIAIIGASSIRPNAAARRWSVFGDGYAGKIHPIHPKLGDYGSQSLSLHRTGAGTGGSGADLHARQDLYPAFSN